MEMRVVRLLSILMFFAAATLFMVQYAGSWGYAGGALLFGAMAAFLYKDEAQSRADSRANREAEERMERQARIRTQQGAAGLPPSPNSSWH